MRFIDALKRPFVAKELLLGVVLSFVPIANFIVTGFALRNGSKAANYDFKQQSFQDPLDLFLAGLGMLAITVVYLLPAIALFLAVALQISPPLEQAVLTNAQIAMVVAGLALAFLAYYVSPAAHIEFGTESFAAAFGVRHIFRKAFTGRYFIAWIVSLLYSTILGVVGALLAIVTAPTFVLPIIIFAFVVYASAVTTYTLLGEAVQE